MRMQYRVLSVVLLLSFSALLQTENGLIAAPLKKDPSTGGRSDVSAKFEATVNALYCDANLEESGLQREVFVYAYKGYLRLLEEHRISKSNVITICDFSQSSRNKRL